MGTQITIDARKRKVFASTEAPNEGTTILAVDLISDSWDDFNYFLHQAADHERNRRFDLRNRYLRAALTNLFAHLDGVVSEVSERLQEDGKLAAPDNARPCSLRFKISGLRRCLNRGAELNLPYLRLDLKPLRDIINHPSVVKTPSPGGAVLLTHIDVYGVAIEDVIGAGKEVDRWLDRLCAVVAFPRFVDTKDAIEKLQASLAKKIPKFKPGDIRRF